MSQFEGVGEALVAMMWLAMVGLAGIIGGVIWGIWWLCHHLHVVVQ